MKRALVAAVLVSVAFSASGAPRERNIGRVLITYYWVIDETNLRYRVPHSSELRDVQGHVIAHTSPWFKRDLRMEGSGRLRDGRVVSYVRDVKGDARYRVSHSPFGDGTGKCPLVPYRTIAVDPRVISLGSKVLIPAFKGTTLPDGSVHDGMFIANDRAPFRGMHIDVFTGIGSKTAKPFVRRGHKSKSRLVAIVVAGPDSRGCHAKR